jgi:hypothetical protein
MAHTIITCERKRHGLEEHGLEEHGLEEHGLDNARHLVRGLDAQAFSRAIDAAQALT